MMLTDPVEILTEDGSVTGVKCRQMKLGEFDRSGRRRPEAGEQSDIIVPADQVIVAIGQKLNASALVGDIELKMNRRGYVEADPVTGQTSVEWVYSGGDSVLGPSSVIEAVSAGERAAIGIDKFLSGKQHAFWRKEVGSTVSFDPDDDPTDDTREKLPLISVERRRNNFDEVELCWNEQTTVRQARRCLRCDFGHEKVAAAEVEAE